MNELIKILKEKGSIKTIHDKIIKYCKESNGLLNQPFFTRPVSNKDKRKSQDLELEYKDILYKYRDEFKVHFNRNDNINELISYLRGISDEGDYWNLSSYLDYMIMIKYKEFRGNSRFKYLSKEKVSPWLIKHHDYEWETGYSLSDLWNNGEDQQEWHQPENLTLMNPIQHLIIHLLIDMEHRGGMFNLEYFKMYNHLYNQFVDFHINYDKDYCSYYKPEVFQKLKEIYSKDDLNFIEEFISSCDELKGGDNE